MSIYDNVFKFEEFETTITVINCHINNTYNEVWISSQPVLSALGANVLNARSFLHPQYCTSWDRIKFKLLGRINENCTLPIFSDDTEFINDVGVNLLINIFLNNEIADEVQSMHQYQANQKEGIQTTEKNSGPRRVILFQHYFYTVLAHVRKDEARLFKTPYVMLLEKNNDFLKQTLYDKKTKHEKNLLDLNLKHSQQLMQLENDNVILNNKLVELRVEHEKVIGVMNSNNSEQPQLVQQLEKDNVILNNKLVEVEVEHTKSIDALNLNHSEQLDQKECEISRLSIQIDELNSNHAEQLEQKEGEINCLLVKIEALKKDIDARQAKQRTILTKCKYQSQQIKNNTEVISLLRDSVKRNGIHYDRMMASEQAINLQLKILLKKNKIDTSFISPFSSDDPLDEELIDIETLVEEIVEDEKTSVQKIVKEDMKNAKTSQKEENKKNAKTSQKEENKKRANTSQKEKDEEKLTEIFSSDDINSSDDDETN